MTTRRKSSGLTKMTGDFKNRILADRPANGKRQRRQPRERTKNGDWLSALPLEAPPARIIPGNTCRKVEGAGQKADDRAAMAHDSLTLTKWFFILCVRIFF